MITLTQTRVSLPRLIGLDERHRNVYSSIDRQPVSDPNILLTWTGLTGDQPTNTRAKPEGGQIHGGHDKAVYAYPEHHYKLWSHILGEEGLGSRSFGENLRIEGISEAGVHVGDIWRIGEVELEVTVPRTPCLTLDMYFNNPKMRKLMFSTGACGWYLRVLRPGIMPTTGRFEVTPKPDNPTIAQAFEAKKAAKQ